MRERAAGSGGTLRTGDVAVRGEDTDRLAGVRDVAAAAAVGRAAPGFAVGVAIFEGAAPGGFPGAAFGVAAGFTLKDVRGNVRASYGEGGFSTSGVI